MADIGFFEMNDIMAFERKQSKERGGPGSETTTGPVTCYAA